MKIAYQFTESSSVSIREAALFAIIAALESWFQQKTNKLFNQNNVKNNVQPSYNNTNVGVLSALTDVMNIHQRNISDNGNSSLCEPIDVIVMMIVFHVIASLKTEVNEQHRALKLEIIRLGVDGMGLYENEKQL